MLLRRVIAHFKKQEWTAIALDFAIVVLGVFLGLQVNNWNAARADREREDIILTRLEADFVQIEAAARNGVASTTRRIETIDALVLQLRQEGAPDVNAIASSFYDALGYSRPVGRSPTYSEILSTGDLSLLKSEPLRTALSQHAEVRETQEKVIDFIVTTITGDLEFQSVQAVADYYARFDQAWLEPRLAELFAQPVMIDQLLISRTNQDGWLYWNQQALESAQAVLAALAEARGEAPQTDVIAPPAGEAP